MLAGLESDSLGKGANLASESLEQQMRWAETHLSPEERNAWLRSMIELYQEKPWAEPLVKSAKQMVDTEP